MTILIVLCLIGTLFVSIELFAPGFGIFGILGSIIFVVVGILSFTYYDLGLMFFVTTLVLCVFPGYIFYLIFKKFGLIKYIVLEENLEVGTEKELNINVGDSGVAITDLKNFGNAQFNSIRVEVFSPTKYINAGSQIVVTKIENNKIIVEQL